MYIQIIYFYMNRVRRKLDRLTKKKDQKKNLSVKHDGLNSFSEKIVDILLKLD